MDDAPGTDLMVTEMTNAKVVPADDKKQELTAQDKTAMRTREASLKAAAIKDAIPQGSKWYLPVDFAQAFKLAEVYYNGGLVPASYKSVQAVMAGMAYASELGLNPLSALKNIAVVNGVPSLWGNLPLALAMTSKFWGGIDEYLIDADGKRICLENGNIKAAAYAAVCIVKSLKDGEKQVIWTMDDAKQAGLLGKQGPWQQYPKDMLRYKARARALMASFTDVLYGITIGEDRFDVLQMEDVSGQRSLYQARAIEPAGDAGALASALAKPAVEPAIDRELVLAGIQKWLNDYEDKDGDPAPVVAVFGGKYFAEWAQSATDNELKTAVAKLREIKAPGKKK